MHRTNIDNVMVTLMYSCVKQLSTAVLRIEKFRCIFGVKAISLTMEWKVTQYNYRLDYRGNTLDT